MADDDTGSTGTPAATRRALTGAELAATCPFVRTLLVNHPDLYDEDHRTMSREQLLGFVRTQRPAGASGSLEAVFAFFATTNQTPFSLWLKNLFRQTDLFSTEFPGSKGDHPGSSGIYRESDGAFDHEAFERVVAHSTDGVTMSHRDVAKAIVESNARETNPGTTLDLARSAGEFALLFNILAEDDGPMRIADMRMLFDENRWPPGALERLGRATAGDWSGLTSEITRAIMDLKFHGDERALAQALEHVQTVVGPMGGE